MSYPKPSPKVMREAFRDFGVNFTEHKKVSKGRSQWSKGLRAATVHHTAGKNSADYLVNNFTPPGANVVINNGTYNGKNVDGRAVILSWGDCWHSGAGGPWQNIAGKDSLHLVSWGIEVESLGTKKDMTAKQIETVGRMLAALVELGMPRSNIHRHADWTDGTAPVGGYPLPTRGRKIDTNKAWYDTKFWKDAQKKYATTGKLWDGKVPEYDNVIAAQNDPELLNKAAWRLACRLADLGNYAGTPRPCYSQGYPWNAVANWQRERGYNVTPPGAYGPKAHEKIFG